MSKFGPYDSVLSVGFTDRDATPPNNPAKVKGYRNIGKDVQAEIRRKAEREQAWRIVYQEYGVKYGGENGLKDKFFQSFLFLVISSSLAI